MLVSQQFIINRTRIPKMLYWENNAHMYWVKEQLCIKLFAEAAYAASAYLSSVAAPRAVEVVKV